jgi:hypothetical protein
VASGEGRLWSAGTVFGFCEKAVKPIRDLLNRLRDHDRTGRLGPFRWPGWLNVLEWFLTLVSLGLLVGFAIAGNMVGVVATIGTTVAGVVLVVYVKESSE